MKRLVPKIWSGRETSEHDKPGFMERVDGSSGVRVFGREQQPREAPGSGVFGRDYPAHEGSIRKAATKTGGAGMKYFEECGHEKAVFSLPICRECEKEIQPGDTVYESPSGVSYLCQECGEQEV